MKPLMDLSDFDFGLTFEHLPDCEILLDWDLNIIAATDRYLDVTQTERDELVGNFLFESFPDNSDMSSSMRTILTELDKLKLTGNSFVLEAHRYDLIDREQRDYRPRYWTLFAMLMPGGKKTDTDERCILYRATDVTDEILHRQYMEERVKAVEVFKVLVDSVRDYAIFLLDVDGCVRTWNEGAARLLQYTENDIIGKHVAIFHSAEDIKQGKPAKGLRTAKETGNFEEEYWRIRKDGSVFWASVIITAVWDERGSHVGFAKVIRDLTERKRAEQKVIEAYEDSSRLKSEFLANMSHEIRTPMNGVLTAATLLADLRRLDAEQEELLGIITESGKSLLKIINDILDYSKIDARELKLVSAPCCVEEVLESIVNLYRVTNVKKKAVTLKLGIDRAAYNERVYVLGDQLRLHQAMLNVIDNAVKFTDQGEVKVELKIQPFAGDRRLADIEITVSDTGIGISSETLAKLFKPFSQGDPSSRKRFKGTGLGLSICKQLVELMGGTLKVTSEEGVGSVFSVRLRLPHISINMSTTDLNDKKGEKMSSFPPARPNVSILVAEDNPINQAVIMKVLRKLGYADVDLANDGIDCIDKFKAKETTGNVYDLILMDVQMPMMDGIEATKRIRQSGSSVPIIAMTANALKGDDDVCIKAGMNAYLSKPLNLRSLAEKMDALIPRLDHDP